jgi:hypothetical protein
MLGRSSPQHNENRKSYITVRANLAFVRSIPDYAAGSFRAAASS